MVIGRNESIHQHVKGKAPAKELIQKEQQLSLAASSHMANTVFDKQVEFANKYSSSVINAFHSLKANSKLDDASSYSKYLTNIRLEYICWLTLETDTCLENFESKLMTLGANSSYLNMQKGPDIDNDYANNITIEMREIQTAFLMLSKNSVNHQDVTLSYLSQTLRKLLNVEELTLIKTSLIKNSLK